MTWTVILDPHEVATNRTELDLDAGAIRVDEQGIDWGDAAIEAYMQNMVIGSTPSDFRIPNRVVTIPIGVGTDDSGQSGFDAAREKLTQKVALFQREGGWLKRGDNGFYADVVNASFTFADLWGETGSFEKGQLVLECLPDFYGDEVTLDTLTGANGVLVSVLKASAATAVIAGDHPARCRLIVTDTSGQDQKGLLWGMRSRHYDSAATAKLFYEAEALTPLDAAATATRSGASGGSVMKHASLPGGSWCPVLLTDIVGTGALTHQGSYRLRARCYSATAKPMLRIQWGVGDVAHPTTNDSVQLPGAAASYIVDLGEIRLDPPATGTTLQWKGVIQAYATSQGDPIEIDCLYFVPLDESSGRPVAVQQDSSLGISITQPAGAGADAAGVGTLTWNNPGRVTTADFSYANLPGTGGQSHWLKATSFGFAIPTGATISGIRLDILRYQPGAGTICKDAAVRLVKAGTIQTPDKADTSTPWPSAPAYKTYGGQSDLWGGTWAPADVNDPNFGAAISVSSPVAGAQGGGPIDLMRITVYYTTSGGFTVTQDAVIYASRNAELRTEGHFRQNSTGAVYAPVALPTGDLPRIPPSGLEARPVELLVKPTRGDLDALADSGLDTFTAQVKYRPTYLFRN